MRIDPKAVVGGYPALTIRKLVRKLNNLLCWNAETVQSILRTERTAAEAIVSALVEAGLAVAQPGQGIDGCTTTPLAQSFGAATAGKPITRQTADYVLSQLLERVNQVNGLSDLDIAVELQPKEVDWGRLRELTRQRVEQLRMAGRRFRSWLEVEYWWHLEAFRFLKGRSRAISLIDYKAEKEFVDRVAHVVLFSCVSSVDADSRKKQPRAPVRRRRRTRDCPF